MWTCSMVIKIKAKSYGLRREGERGAYQHRWGSRGRNEVETMRDSRIRLLHRPNLMLAPGGGGRCRLGGHAVEGQGSRIRPPSRT